MSRKANATCAHPQDEQAARDKCLRLLGVRARSSAELRDRLTSIGFAGDVVDRVLSDLERVGLVDDEEFARSWVASRHASGSAGRRKLRWELRRKGIPDELIRRVLEQIADEAELRRAMDLAQGRLQGRPVAENTLPRLRRFLLARGFEFDTVDSVLRRISRKTEHS